MHVFEPLKPPYPIPLYGLVSQFYGAGLQGVHQAGMTIPK